LSAIFFFIVVLHHARHYGLRWHASYQLVFVSSRQYAALYITGYARCRHCPFFFLLHITETLLILLYISLHWTETPPRLSYSIRSLHDGASFSFLRAHFIASPIFLLPLILPLRYQITCCDIVLYAAYIYAWNTVAAITRHAASQPYRHLLLRLTKSYFFSIPLSYASAITLNT
jgi:hypothetical protein